MNPDTVKFSGYIAVACPNIAKHPMHPHQWTTTARLSKGKPSVGRDEVAVKIEIELPASLFTRPTLEARISVPPGSATPLTVELETRSNVEELIRQSTGFDVKLLPVEAP